MLKHLAAHSTQYFGNESDRDLVEKVKFNIVLSCNPFNILFFRESFSSVIKRQTFILQPLLLV